eukprot:Awhi_evm2s384
MMLVPCRHILTVNNEKIELKDVHYRWWAPFMAGEYDLVLPVRSFDIGKGPVFKGFVENMDAFDHEAEEQSLFDDLNSAATDVQEIDLDKVEESELDKKHRLNLLEEANIRLGKALDDVIRSAYITVSGDEHLRPIPESEICSRLTSANKKLMTLSKNNIKYQLLADTILARMIDENNNVVIPEDSNDLVMDPPRVFSSQKSNKRTKNAYESVYPSSSSSRNKRSKIDV